MGLAGAITELPCGRDLALSLLLSFSLSLSLTHTHLLPSLSLSHTSLLLSLLHTHTSRSLSHSLALSLSHTHTPLTRGRVGLAGAMTELPCGRKVGVQRDRVWRLCERQASSKIDSRTVEYHSRCGGAYMAVALVCIRGRKVPIIRNADARLPAKGNSSSHGASPVYYNHLE